MQSGVVNLGVGKSPKRRDHLGIPVAKVFWPGGGGGGTLNIYWWGCAAAHPKRGVLGTGTTQKRGVLGTGTTQKGGS